MKKYAIYLGLSVLVMSCSQNIPTLNFNQKNVDNSQQSNWVDKQKQEFLDKMNNKNKFVKNINNDLLQDSESKTYIIKHDNKSPVVFTKDFNFSKHKTQKNHVKKDDYNILDEKLIYMTNLMAQVWYLLSLLVQSP